MAELSPKSMAEAAYTNAVTQMKNNNNTDDLQKEVNQSNTNGGEEDGGVVLNTNDTADNTPPNIGDTTARIEKIWQASSNSKDANLEKTISLLVGELDNFIQCGLSGKIIDNKDTLLI